MKTINRGHCYNRTKTCQREKSFADNWESENEPLHYINNGHGLLQDLFIERKGFTDRTMIHEITEDERMVCATVVQWLGTNCGMSFLGRALNQCGYEIINKNP